MFSDLLFSQASRAASEAGQQLPGRTVDAEPSGCLTVFEVPRCSSTQLAHRHTAMLANGCPAAAGAQQLGRCSEASQIPSSSAGVRQLSMFLAARQLLVSLAVPQFSSTAAA